MYIDDIYAPPIMALMARELSTLTILRDSDKRRIEALTAETEAQAAEIKRLQGELEKGRPEEPAHKYSVGDRVQAHGGLVGTIQAIDAAFSNFPYLVKWHSGEESWAGIYSLSPAPVSPDAALPTV